MERHTALIRTSSCKCGSLKHTEKVESKGRDKQSGKRDGSKLEGL